MASNTRLSLLCWLIKETGVRVEANGEGRQEGERQAVDPVNSSTGQAATWDRIVEFPLGIFDAIDAIDAIDGDKDVFGRVYVAFASAGFAYGRPVVPER